MTRGLWRCLTQGRAWARAWGATGPTLFVCLLVLFWVLNCADAVLTGLALPLGGVEWNVLPPWSKLGSCLLVVACTLTLQALHPRAAVVLLASGCVLYAFVVASNLWTLGQLVMT